MTHSVIQINWQNEAFKFGEYQTERGAKIIAAKARKKFPDFLFMVMEREAADHALTEFSTGSICLDENGEIMVAEAPCVEPECEAPMVPIEPVQTNVPENIRYMMRNAVGDAAKNSWHRVAYKMYVTA